MDFKTFETFRVIAIDGDTGAGKSYIANEISKVMAVDLFDLDAYLPTPFDSYSGDFNYDHLKDDILSASNKSIKVFCGICVLSMLQRLRMEYDCLVFCKAYEGGLRKYDRFLRDASLVPKVRLHKEILDYYKKFRPCEKAMYITHHFIDDECRNMRWEEVM